VSATFVANLTPEQGRALYTELGHGSFQFRRVDHAWWAAQGNDVSVVFYRSGKLVAQGKGVDVFIERYRSILGEAAPADAGGTQGRAHARETFVAHATCPTAGSDESGKGDYFGPMAVAAVLVRPDQAELLKRLDIVDSKLAGDARIRQSEGLLLRDLVCAVRVLDPEAYNAAWEEVRNVNVLLGRLHAEVLGEVLAKAKDPAACRIVVDKFGDPSHVTKHLSAHAKKAAFSMITGGEREPAVAAASFLARAAFLRGFDALRNDAGTDLPLGASDPRIVPCARALLREGGMPWLRKFAKLHFKTTQRAEAGGR
jgi:ribonuclease HIII